MTDPVITDYYLIRHAPVAGSKSGIYASADEPADLSNTDKFKAVSTRLPTNAVWFTSPLKRTQMTANALAELLGKPSIKIDNRLTEQDFGNWFGLTPEKLWAKIKHLKGHNWAWLSAETIPDGGESFLDIWKRTAAFMEDTVGLTDNRPRVIVSHAGVIRAFIGNALSLSPDTAISLGINTLSLSHMQHTTGERRGGAWRLVSQNT
ncbi:histidine phosphatase family protein [Kordiimonas sp. SCSIO 12610]|uniref:histidine phosphatase family protein n=1 Tax=Kordiimonas sp. SCSIO 12610 TaxID=2829597 RepID=UPI00210AE0DC|nr:histidine phosphatase family protein [Kordiimonas sp. SCSIO 12610]UTW55935.1 histidine phosphatase family protein [Kordiimonas sp. SCSIO 12610]